MFYAITMVDFDFDFDFVNQGNSQTPGSGYVLLHHVMGESDGERGIWSYVMFY